MNEKGNANYRNSPYTGKALFQMIEWARIYKGHEAYLGNIKLVINGGTMKAVVQMTKMLFVVLLLAHLGGEAKLLLAQQLGTSALNGSVADPTGAVVPGAKVTLISNATHFTRTATTNGNGLYSFNSLTPGVYDLSVEAQGFHTADVKSLQFFVGQTAVQNIHLATGEVSSKVTVSAAPPLLNQDNAVVGTEIEQKTISEMPLNGRSFLQLNLLAPGVTRSKNGNTFDGVQIDPTVQSFNVNGSHGDYNAYLLDGTNIKEYNTGSIAFAPSVDAIQEFQVATSNYSAQLGTEAGGQVNVATKSGTNEFHGDVFEFIRNNIFNSKNYFATSVSPFKQNQFGGTVGGPVLFPKLYNGRNKTFFFASYQGFRLANEGPSFGNYPTPTQLTGDLSSLATPNKPVIDPVTGLPFPGNIIPANRIPANLVSFFQTGIGKGPWLPTPNSSIPGQDYAATLSNYFNANQFIARVDQKLGDSTFMYVRYADNRAAHTPGNLNPNWSTSTTQPAKSIAGNISHTFSPTLQWDNTVGFSQFAQHVTYTTQGKDDIMNKILHINGVPTAPETWGVFNLFLTGYTDLGELYAAPSDPSSDVLEIHSNFTKIKGRHNIAFGGEFERYYDTVEQLTEGSESFDGSLTGYALGDFLIGHPVSTSTSSNGFNAEARYSQASGYVQDDWKITPNLTFNLGFRYDWSGIPASSNHSYANWFVGPNSLHSSILSDIFTPNHVPMLVVSNSNPQPVVFLGQSQPLFTGIPFVAANTVGLPEALGFAIKKDIGPRLGFAYTIPNSSGTVIRGGYGIFYQRDSQNKYGDEALNPPFNFNLNGSFNQSNFQQFDWFNPFAGASASNTGAFANAPNSRDADVNAWNLTVEKQVRSTLFSIAYVGNTAHHMANIETPNQARPGPGSFASRQIWPTFGTLYYQDYNSNANYNSLQTKIQRAYSNGFSFLASYTWSKTIDDGGGTFVGEGGRGFEFQDTYNRGADRGLADQDIRNRFVISYVYQLPFGRGRQFMNQNRIADAVLGQWQAQGITTFQSGSPVGVGQSCNRANTNAGSMRPDLLHNPNDLPARRPHAAEVDEWFDTTAFVNVCPGASGPFSFGNAGRNMVIGPGEDESDFGIAKDLLLFSDVRKLQFRAEAFNLFNHPVFGQPAGTAGNDNFGRIAGTTIDARELQFAMKLYF